MREYLQQALQQALQQIQGVPDDFEPELELPNDPDHGDLATNSALQLAGPLGRAPRSIAEELAEHVREEVDASRISSVQVAGPGFINFRFAEAHVQKGLEEILARREEYGRTDNGQGTKVLVEYVSANPTGPLTVGHGRNAVLGDTVANLLEWAGYSVTREYYFNNGGRQMRILGQSVRARYEEICNPDMPTRLMDIGGGETVEVPVTFPDGGYLGEYVTDVAQQLFDGHGEDLLQEDDERIFREAAEQAIFEEIEQTLLRLGIEMDTYFNENDLYDDGDISEVLEELRDKGYVYEDDGATWFKTIRFGKDKDTVLVKSTGEPTYRLPDIAYHRRKYRRGYDLMIDVFGADHIATYPDVLSGVEVLGYDPDKVDVLIYQFVTLVKSGEPVKMSTRRANYVTLDDLMDEVSEDVTRFFFLMRSANSHLEFDLDVAKEASEKNPVFYLQYAHARICSIVDKAKEVGFTFQDDADLTLLTHEAEEALTKQLLLLPGTLERAAEARAPHRIANYLRDVAEAFTQFYGHCHIIGEEPELATARMKLAEATRIVLRNGLSVLGISAPESM